MDRSEHAVEQFASGLNCAQAVFTEFAEANGLDPELAVRVASGFGGGMGLGDTCGAVTGAIMAIGLASAGPDPRDPLAKAQSHALVQSFLAAFVERHGSLACRDLLDCGADFPQALQEASSRGYMQTKCARFVRDAVEIVEELV